MMRWYAVVLWTCVLIASCFVCANGKEPYSLYGIGGNNDFGCIVEITSLPNGNASCVWGNHLFGDIDPNGAELIYDSTKTFVYGTGPCCAASWSSYVVADFKTGELLGPININGSAGTMWAAGVDSATETLYGFFQDINDEFMWRIARLDHNLPLNYSVEFTYHTSIFFGEGNNPAVLFHKGVMVAYGPNSGTPGTSFVFIDTKKWEIIKTFSVPQQISFGTYDPTTGILYGLVGTNFENTFYLSLINLEKPTVTLKGNGTLFCNNDDCEFFGCATEPGSGTLICHGAFNTNLCPPGNVGTATWSINAQTGRILKSPIYCAPIGFSFMFFSNLIANPHQCDAATSKRCLFYS